MSYLSLLLCIVVISMLFPTHDTPIQAQDDPQWWQDGCDPRAQADIIPTTDVFDYGVVCDEYRLCDPNDNGDPICQMKALDMLLQQCPADDDTCQQAAVLYAAAILAYDMPFGEYVNWGPPQSMIDNLPIALKAFWEADYEAALDAYNQTPRDDYPEDIMLPLSRAIIYQLLDQPEAALAEYDIVFGTVFDDPLTRYARAQLYGSLGRDTEATLDVMGLALILENEPELARLVVPLQDDYPPLELEEWLVYPITSISLGVVGTFETDRTLEAPRTVQMLVLPDLQLLVAVGLQNWGSDGWSDENEIQLILQSTDSTTYRFSHYSSTDYSDNSNDISIVFGDNMIRGSESLSYFEGGGYWEFALALPDAPDPRATLSGERVCENGAFSRVKIGDRVQGVSYADSLALAENTGEMTSISFFDEVTLIAGPECVGSIAWWQAEDPNTGDTGWIPEYDESNTYVIASVSPE